MILFLTLLRWSWSNKAKVLRSDGGALDAVSRRRVSECAHLALSSGPGSELGMNSEATAGPAWLHVWPPAPCVVLGGQWHRVPRRHVRHPEHLVGGGPPRSLGSSRAYTGLGLALRCVRRGFRDCDPLIPWHLADPKGLESRGPADCPFALSPRSKPRDPVITKQLSWRP